METVETDSPEHQSFKSEKLKQQFRTIKTSPVMSVEEEQSWY